MLYQPVQKLTFHCWRRIGITLFEACLNFAGGTHMRLSHMGFWLAFLFTSQVASPVLSDGLTLAPGDVVELSVFARPDISRTYRVRSDGSVSLHLIGALQAKGLEPSELEAVLETRLSETLEEPISATLEVVTWRPVTVSGDVASPGSVGFLPGTDVRMALAQAGGVLNGLDLLGQDVSVRMNVQTAVGDVAELKAKLANLIVVRDQLQRHSSSTAPTEPIAEISVLNDLIEAEVADRLIAAQETFHVINKEEFVLNQLAEEDQLALASFEAETFSNRQKVIADQLVLANEELASQEQLLARGITLADRIFNLRQSSAQLRGEELEAVALQAGAAQRVEQLEASISLAELRQERDIARRLAELEGTILEVSTQLDQARAFVVSFGGAAMLEDGEEPSEVFTIFRRTDEGVTELAAEKNTLLKPGDVLDVSANSAVPG